MISECLWRSIERPSGLSGYRPAFWCAVCGRKASPQAEKHCVTEGCPNICHDRCLGEDTEFKCSNTGQLRVRLGIDDPVTFHTQNTQEAPTLSNLHELVEEEGEDDLAALRKEELVCLVKNLRRDLASTKCHLTNYRYIISGLADKRNALVEALSIVDTLLATYSSEDKQQRSVACTAKPHKLERETVSTGKQLEGGLILLSQKAVLSILLSPPSYSLPSKS